jgi:predicted nucleic acid-binding protein
VIVVDASIALAWCMADEQDDVAELILERVAREPAIAPAHWPLEVANGLLSAERRGRITDDEQAHVARLLDGLGIEVVPVELSTARWSVLDAAREHGLSAYDAAYLDLARFKGLPLATLDGPLREACRSAGVVLAG